MKRSSRDAKHPPNQPPHPASIDPSQPRTHVRLLIFLLCALARPTHPRRTDETTKTSLDTGDRWIIIPSKHLRLRPRASRHRRRGRARRALRTPSSRFAARALANAPRVTLTRVQSRCAPRPDGINVQKIKPVAHARIYPRRTARRARERRGRCARAMRRHRWRGRRARGGADRSR